ncbi:MAG: DUF2939 domain-containing protein [Pyrinomonadaceae bacterium]
MSTAPGKNPRPKRGRIVIELGQQGARGVAPKGKRRGSLIKKVLAVIALLLVAFVLVALVGGYFWWQHYKTGPAYSLALLVDAAQRNDVETVDRLVDTDKIVDNFVSQVTERAMGQSSSLLNPQLSRQIQTLAPKMLPQIKRSVHDELMKQVKEFSTRAEGKPFALIAVSIPFILDFKEEGDTAQVKGEVKNKPIEMTMQRDGEQWKIVAVKNDELAARIINDIAGRNIINLLGND